MTKEQIDAKILEGIQGGQINAGSKPLWVVDGVIMDDGIDNLDPSVIENLTVLKDAEAAVYGSRAANGVVIVTLVGTATGK